MLISNLILLGILSAAAANDAQEEKKSAWVQAPICRRAGAEEYCAYAHVTFNHGEGISLITTSARLAKLASQPPFSTTPYSHHPLQAPNSTMNLYRDVETPGKGIGLISTAPLRTGTRVMAKTPAIMVDDRAFKGLRQNDLSIILYQAAQLLPTTHRERFLNLTTGTDGRIKYSQRTRFRTPVADGDGDFQSCFTEASRLNHDCRPNLGYYFHASTPRPPGIRNDRISQMSHLRKILDDRSPPSAAAALQGARATPEMAELLITLMELEGLHVRIDEAYYRAALEFNGVGDALKAIKYARLCLDRGLVLRGPDRPFIISMKELIRAPTGHWSWKFRIPT
ncbi:hypothetical protein QBC46DRAFT_418037 [Diplogelasinospora grovesii]|uniref:SET domain-containing protein n=1 Tax=Diplogelasinospora grovesii TaxID=303347 RepID=A0AAN6S1B1_9PEZI|nr:hypothetical protein QBC46DRAFT_418037 [Diplogelasinospora grovesii]